MGDNVLHIGLGCAFAVLFCDQLSKAYALTALSDAPMQILPVFNLTLMHNDGVSFGLFSKLVPWWGLTLLNCGIAISLIVWLWFSSDPFTSSALGLMIGGALGNAIDRVRHGAVTDFLDFHLAGSHWPAFNIADIGVVCGAALLIFVSTRTEKAA